MSSVAGRLAQTMRLRLNTLQPGDYVLAYEARAAKRIVTREILFTVTND